METLVWLPSRATLRVAALFDLFLLVWVVAMLLSYWIVVEYDNCEMNGVPVEKAPGFWIFIEAFCSDDPGTRSMRGSCNK